MIHAFYDYCRNYVPNETHHLPLLPAGRKLTSHYAKDIMNAKESAVGVHLYPNNQKDPCFAIILRSEYEGKHSGQYALPGGKREWSDISLEDCARRECMEELGISIKDGECLNALSPVFIPVSNFMMHPYLFSHSVEPTWQINNREIQKIIHVELSTFVEKTPIIWKEIEASKNSRFSGTVPGFQLNEHWIWGATALVLSELKAIYLGFQDDFKSKRAP